MGAGGDWKINLLFDFYWIYRDVFVESQQLRLNGI